MLPDFTSEGLLPPGEYELTLEEIRKSFLVRGPAERKGTWDKGWRGSLVDRLEKLVKQLRQVSAGPIVIGGSFVEDKDHPSDIDGYFECELTYLASGNLERDLNLLDPYKCWTWDPQERQRYRGYPKLQLPMWHIYRIELYSHVGLPSGIKDEFGNDLEFPAAFRRSKQDGKPKGVIKIGGES